MLWLESNRPLVTVDIVDVYRRQFENRNSSKESLYYFISDSIDSTPVDLPVGPRILVLAESMVFNVPGYVFCPLEDTEGPYESVRQLKENSEMFKRLISTSPKRAQKIFEDRYLISMGWEECAALPITIDDEFHNIIFKILHHTLVGSFKNKDVSGIHYYDEAWVRSREIISIDNRGVFEAFVDVYNHYTNQWIQKQALTSFFPKSLSFTGIAMECEYAYKRRIRLSETKFVGISESGIMIVFFFRNNQLQTVYPVCEES